MVLYKLVRCPPGKFSQMMTPSSAAFDRVRSVVDNGSSGDVRRLLASPEIGALTPDEFLWLVTQLV